MLEPKRIDLEEMLKDMDDDTQKAVRALANDPSVTAIVLFETLPRDSLHFGDRTIMAVGPELTYEMITDAIGRLIDQTPSTLFRYAMATVPQQKTCNVLPHT